MGALCAGRTDPGPVQLRDSKAYAEGRQAAVAGALVGTNPHPANSSANVAWTAGHGSWAADPAGGPAEGRDCCADAFGGGFTP